MALLVDGFMTFNFMSLFPIFLNVCKAMLYKFQLVIKELSHYQLIIKHECLANSMTKPFNQEDWISTAIMLNTLSFR